MGQTRQADNRVINLFYEKYQEHLINSPPTKSPLKPVLSLWSDHRVCFLHKNLATQQNNVTRWQADLAKTPHFRNTNRLNRVNELGACQNQNMNLIVINYKLKKVILQVHWWILDTAHSSCWAGKNVELIVKCEILSIKIQRWWLKQGGSVLVYNEI